MMLLCVNETILLCALGSLLLLLQLCYNSIHAHVCEVLVDVLVVMLVVHVAWYSYVSLTSSYWSESVRVATIAIVGAD
jgi:hypothetical protein